MAEYGVANFIRDHGAGQMLVEPVLDGLKRPNRAPS